MDTSGTPPISGTLNIVPEPTSLKAMLDNWNVGNGDAFLVPFCSAFRRVCARLGTFRWSCCMCMTRAYFKSDPPLFVDGLVVGEYFVACTSGNGSINVSLEGTSFVEPLTNEVMLITWRDVKDTIDGVGPFEDVDWSVCIFGEGFTWCVGWLLPLNQGFSIWPFTREASLACWSLFHILRPSEWEISAKGQKDMHKVTQCWSSQKGFHLGQLALERVLS